jgi:hypothetical protein
MTSDPIHWFIHRFTIPDLRFCLTRHLSPVNCHPLPVMPFAVYCLLPFTIYDSRFTTVKFGFCPGLEQVNYVANILERFNHYKQFVET